MIDKVPQFALHNRQSFAFSESVGCFHCLEIYPKTEVKEWVDRDQTAICPRCGCDTVVPDGCGFELSKKSLEAANRFWFVKKERSSLR